jgi:serine/threonine protein kinase
LWDDKIELQIQDQINFGECIGQGSFARVYQAQDNILGGLEVAVKVIDKRKMTDDRRKMLV